MWQFELSSNKCWRICPALQPCHQSTKSIVSCSSFGCQRWQGGDRKKATAVASQKKSPTQGRKRHDWNQTQWQLETLPPFCWVLSHKTALQSSHQHQLWSGFESCEQSWLMLTLGFLQIKERYNSMQLTSIIKWKPIIIFPTTHGRVMNRLRRFSPLPERKSYGWRSWGCRRWCLFLLLIIMIVNYNNNYYQIEIALYISYTSSAVYLLKKLTLANTIFTSTHHPSTPSTRHPHWRRRLHSAPGSTSTAGDFFPEKVTFFHFTTELQTFLELQDVKIPRNSGHQVFFGILSQDPPINLHLPTLLAGGHTQNVQ